MMVELLVGLVHLSGSQQRLAIANSPDNEILCGNPPEQCDEITLHRLSATEVAQLPKKVGLESLRRALYEPCDPG